MAKETADQCVECVAGVDREIIEYKMQLRTAKANLLQQRLFTVHRSGRRAQGRREPGQELIDRQWSCAQFQPDNIIDRRLAEVLGQQRTLAITRWRPEQDQALGLCSQTLNQPGAWHVR
ncbi:hypothetical protein [Pseudomonas sp. R37(2017)]|uniref:hypothetical protein n=1 Tax=Pseudomonas sp. R37(2017) TaxID=1981685 RepID=UPI000A1F2529|nr:hypothetical protein [Pseudomonas sp. R37(2017)]